MRKKVLALILCICVSLGLAGCGNNQNETAQNGEKEKLTIAYQPSIAYAPMLVMKQQELIEKQYGKDIEIEWKEMTSGSAINDGFVSGDIDIGGLGVAPAVIGVQSGIPYKIFAGISGQPYAIMTNQDQIQSLKDITEKDQISVVAINSMPHILLAKAAKAYLGDAHALDSNLVALSNTDGYTSLLSGATQCQMCISPFNFMDAKEEGIHEIPVDKEVWSNGDTFIVGVASNSLYENNKELYDAIYSAMQLSMDYIEQHPEDTAKLIAEGYDQTPEEIGEWMADERSSYSVKLKGVMDLVGFMKEEGFLEKAPESIKDITFDNVEGE